MKRIGIIFVVIAFTAVIVMFPSLYYANRDKALDRYQNENVYKINTITDISLEKEIEILVDENSRYIEQNYSMNSEEEQILMEIKKQLDAIVGVDLDDNMLKNANYNRVRVINSSAYNVYSFDLGVFDLYEEVQITMFFDINKRKILYLQLNAPVDDIYLFAKRAEDITNQVEKHYESYKNWECNVDEYYIEIKVSSSWREMEEMAQRIRTSQVGNKENDNGLIRNKS